MRPFPLAPDKALVVLGALNAKPWDRDLARDDIRPVQIVTVDGVEPAPFFDGWGPLGVSSMAFDPRSSRVFVSTGADLAAVDLASGAVARRDVPGLVDVHEIALVGDRLWIANTGADELVVASPDSDATRRIGLRSSGTAPPSPGPAASWLSRYHVNQAFEGLDGRMYALVHHVRGRQLIQRIADKIVKSQGDGGVLVLETGEVVGLDLKAPHSVRIVGDEHWLFDSGNGTVARYDAEWKPRGTFGVGGWGRGAALSDDGSVFYTGISSTRKRYLAPGGPQTPNCVRAFDAKDGGLLGEVVLTGIEQITNVYAVDRAVARSLASLGGRA